jgi:hypothetical protein
MTTFRCTRVENGDLERPAERTEGLEAAQHWRQECLLGDGGIFSGESLWTLANLDEVKSAFLESNSGQ